MVDVLATKNCWHCNGTGTVPVYTVPGDPPSSTDVCPLCEGDGTFDLHTVDMSAVEALIATVDVNAVAARDEAAAAKVRAEAVEAKVDVLLLGDDLLASHAIFNATDLTEYNALTDSDKENYKFILSMGVVDLSDGGNARTLLMGMFGPGTATRAAIAALLD